MKKKTVITIATVVLAIGIPGYALAYSAQGILTSAASIGGIDPGLAAFLTTAAKYAPLAEKLASGQKPTLAEIGQISTAMNNGKAGGINFAGYGLTQTGDVKALNPDGSVNMSDTSGDHISTILHNAEQGKILHTDNYKAIYALATNQAAAKVASDQQQATAETSASVIAATGESMDNTSNTTQSESAASANCGSSFCRDAVRDKIAAASLSNDNTKLAQSTAGLALQDLSNKYLAIGVKSGLQKQSQETNDRTSATYVQNGFSQNTANSKVIRQAAGNFF